MEARSKRKQAPKKHKKRSTGTVKLGSKRSLGIQRISRIEGVEKLLLSPLTQQILDCRIGINITTQQPWIFIRKEKILENLELHEHSSEFLPIKQEIDEYPADEILIGCYGHEQNVPEEFLVCITLNSAQITLEALQVQEALRHQKIIDSIQRTCGIWYSNGSEEEVDENMPLTLRKPYQIHLTSETSTFFVKCRFSLRLVEDSPYGYAEMTSPRQTFCNVFRKRVHSYMQCSNLKESTVTQTLILPVMNKTTSDCYTMIPKKMHPRAVEDFISRLDDEYMLDLLQTNYYMDLCRNDYVFKGARKMQLFKFPICILTFQDIFSCRRKRVSCVTWNAMQSGLIAASYVKQPKQMVVERDSPIDTSHIIFDDHLILVWSYSSVVQPYLYLHSNREVNVVSFCSYNPNIIVAGCENGQIVVWDISGRLEKTANLKASIVNRNEEHNLTIQLLMTWMKKPPAIQHVYPVLSSKLDVSHLSPITYIEWLPPDHKITKNGKFQRKKDNDQQMQFLVCGNGFIELWDVGLSKDAENEMSRKKKPIRLTKLPDALTKYISPLKALQSNFIPVFRIWLQNPKNRKPLSICKLLEKPSCLVYRALNPETQSNLLRKTHYEHFVTKENLWQQEFIFTTNFGEMGSVKWDGFDYDQGGLINSNIGEISSLTTYHDGPVIVCMESPVIRGLILTIGGRVFAIWSIHNLQVPLFWRKSAHRYVSGSWLSIQPFQIGVVRYDTFKEIWDLMDDSKGALKVIKGSGRAADGVYNDYQRMHAKKGSFVETNVAGEINVYSVPRDFMDIKNKEVKEVVDYLENIERRRERLNKWTDKIKKNILANTEEVVEAVVEDSDAKREQNDETPNRVSRKSILPQQNKWQAKEEAWMREVLFSNKKLKMDQLEQNSELLRQAELLRQKHAIKFAEQLKNKDKNMKAWKMLLLPDELFTRKSKITVSFPKNMYDYMKQNYVQSYLDIEQATLQYIKTHVYHMYCSWAKNLRASSTLDRKHKVHHLSLI